MVNNFGFFLFHILKWLGLLSFYLGVYIKYPTLVDVYYYGGIVLELIRRSAPQDLIVILTATLVSSLIGFLIGCFSRGFYQSVLLGLGVGSTLAIITSLFPIGLLAVIILLVLLGVCSGFVQGSHPVKNILIINWVGSYFLTSAIFLFFSLMFDGSKLSIPIVCVLGFSFIVVNLCTFISICYYDKNSSYEAFDSTLAIV